MISLGHKILRGDSVYKLYSALIGVFVAIMIAFNGLLSNNIGNNLAAIIIHLVGLAAIGSAVLFNRKKIIFHRHIPLYLYSAGAIGVFTVIFSNMSFNSLGASLTFSLSLLGQSVASIIVDNYGWLGMKTIKFRKEKIIGLLLISLGIIIMAIY